MPNPKPQNGGETPNPKTSDWVGAKPQTYKELVGAKPQTLNGDTERRQQSPHYDILFAMLQYVIVRNVLRRQSSPEMFEFCDQSLLGKFSCTAAILVA